MAQRAILSPGNSKMPYRSATTHDLSPSPSVSVQTDDTTDSAAGDSWSGGARRDRFPGWLRVAIIVAGALLSWGAVAAIVSFVR